MKVIVKEDKQIGIASINKQGTQNNIESEEE